MASSIMTDQHGTVTIIDESGLDLDQKTVRDAVVQQHPEVAELIRWTMSNFGDVGLARQGSLFSRDRYVTPGQIFKVFKVAQDAVVYDDIVSGVAESIESLALSKVDFFSESYEEQDIWNQIGFDLDLDSRVREMWRELFTLSQFYAVVFWGQKSYRVRGKNADTGVKRKKMYNNLTVPLGITLLDPTKVIPVGNLMFNQEQLCYIADRTEVDTLDAAVLNDPQADPVSRAIIMAKYAPPDYERRNIAKLGVNPEWLYILNPKYVFRHTLTRPQYQRFADPRLKSIFELLDMKHQLREMDRATLIGGTNFIVVVKKGSDKLPAKPQEITNLQSQITTSARIPILIGDHRLSVEIITPKVDHTLDAVKWGTIDSRLETRLYQMFLVHGGAGSVRSDDSIKLGKAIARGMESRRYMLRSVLERRVFGPCADANPEFDFAPQLRFHPHRIELSFDPAMAQLVLDMRDRGDISRETYIAELDYDQEDEAIKRQREAEQFDQSFAPVSVPFSNPLAVGPGQAPQPGSPGTKPAAQKAPSATKKAAPRNPRVAEPNSVRPQKSPGVNSPNINPKTQDPRTAGRNQGGNRNGGGAAGGQLGRGKPKNR